MFPLSMMGMSRNLQQTPSSAAAMQPVTGMPQAQQTQGNGQVQQTAGAVSPLVQALLAQKMGSATGAAQASPLGALGAASNPVAGALMAQRMGLMK